MLKDNLNIAIKNIKERKSRVFLTLIGIAIGIMAIVSLMGIGEGMNQAVTGELSSLSDMIIVSTGGFNINTGGYQATNGGESEYFTDRDLDDIRRIQGIKDMSPVLYGAGVVEYNGETEFISVLAMDPTSMSNIFGIDFVGLYDGEFMQEGDQNRCIIGYKIAHEKFDVDLHVGTKIEINGYNFVVNGIYNQQGAGFSTETDDYIHMTPRDFEKITGQNNISGILVRVYDVSEVESIADQIEMAINENHGDDEFTNTITMSSLVESIQSVLSIIQVVLLAIAAIALVVASIGIMNTMLTSVMERTHEIGIMKAIGAKNTDVMSIFIMEGFLISLIGGIVGLILGVGGSIVLSTGLGSFFGGGGVRLEPIITLTSVILAISVSMLVGIVSSLYPARKAARMSPIEAVRYE